LVLYHNRFAETAGWVRISTAAARIEDGKKSLVQRSLGEGLALTATDGVYTRFRDFISGLEHLRPSRDLCERGFHVELRAYQCRVYLDFREVRDSARDPWGQLERELGGRGVPSLDDALDE